MGKIITKIGFKENRIDSEKYCEKFLIGMCGNYYMVAENDKEFTNSIREITFNGSVRAVHAKNVIRIEES